MSSKAQFDIIVIGAGAMGLAAAYEATKQGLNVLVLEAGPVAGGMAAHQDLDGLSIERYYHFICKTDYDTFGLMQELGIRNKLNWVTTKMGYYTDGKLHPWGNPVALLQYPHLSFFEKLRYGLMVFYATKRKNWDAVEALTAPDWIKLWVGQKAYDKLWHRLFTLKFYEYTSKISATWIGTRIKRIGMSRKSIFEEQLGYIEGGTETLVAAMVATIEKKGGIIRCAQPVERVKKNNNTFEVTTSTESLTASKVISTVPTPLVSRMIPMLPEADKVKYDSIPNIGVACLIFKLRRPVSKNFWVNIIDENLPVPGIIEFSNLRSTGHEHVVYVPYYMPATEKRWSWSDKALIDEAFGTIRAIRPDLTREDLIIASVNRLRYSQPICVPNFLDVLPPIQTAIEGLQIADTSFYYPEDRGISESIKLGRNMARRAIGLPSRQYDSQSAPSDLRT